MGKFSQRKLPSQSPILPPEPLEIPFGQTDTKHITLPRFTLKYHAS